MTIPKMTSAKSPQTWGEQALQAQIGNRFTADWKSDDHRLRRLVSEFIGTSGLTFVLSSGAAILATYGGGTLAPYQYAFILSTVAALWLVAAIYFLGDISAHFNPAMTLAFAIRGDMGAPMAAIYIVVQLIAAAAGSSLAALLFGMGGNLAATVPPPDMLMQAVVFESVITFGMILLVLSMANGPKLNGSFVPIAVGAYIMCFGTLGGPFDGAAMNPARAFGPDFARGDFSTYWVYPLGALIGVVLAVAIERVLRGKAKAQESEAAMGTPLNDN
jgi:aquaporin Z